MVSFGDLSSDSGVKELDQYLLSRSYISGCDSSVMQEGAVCVDRVCILQ